MGDLALIDAVKAGSYAEAQDLIQAGVDVNQKDQLGWSALSFAAGAGSLDLVKLLEEAGADIFCQGRDLRTPYMIALAAGRAEVVAYLGRLEEANPGEKPVRPERKYCKAYYLRDLRHYPAWTESRLNWKNAADGGGPFPEDKIVFIHQDSTVTESMWQNESVIFKDVDESWKEFCANSLNFKVPTDLDLIVQTDNAGQCATHAV